MYFRELTPRECHGLYDKERFFKNPKALERPAIILVSDWESLLLSPSDICHNCNVVHFGRPRCRCESSFETGMSYEEVSRSAAASDRQKKEESRHLQLCFGLVAISADQQVIKK